MRWKSRRKAFAFEIHVDSKTNNIMYVNNYHTPNINRQMHSVQPKVENAKSRYKKK